MLKTAVLLNIFVETDTFLEVVKNTIYLKWEYFVHVFTVAFNHFNKLLLSTCSNLVQLSLYI